MLQMFLLSLQLASPAQAARADCTEEEINALNFAAEALARGDDGCYSRLQESRRQALLLMAACS